MAGGTGWRTSRGLWMLTLMEMVTTWALRENRRTGLAPLVRREEKWREEGRGESRREVKKQVLW